MKVVICAIAKCENEYINDWVNYHLALGFDEIYIYDNNDIDYEPVESRIKIKSGKVFIQKIPGRPVDNLQDYVYTDFYNRFNKEFDWCAYIDIDEYIELTKWSNIKDFLNEDIFTSYPIIRLNMRLFGDDDLIDRDRSIPVYKGITKCLLTHKFSSGGKQLIRGNIKGAIPSVHSSKINGSIPNQINPDGIVGRWWNDGLPDSSLAHINHYRTKTLAEFIDQKIHRGDACFKNKQLDFKYFWEQNTKTKEKLDYIRQRGL